jgi:uncharacterized protein (UPF0333 family)
MLNNNKAQQSSEYAVVFILIGLAVILMGPFVIRAWNAHIKSWEDSVIDSYRDTTWHVEEPGVSLPTN